MSLLSLHSPAKVNLFLKILGRRPDGYHQLSTLLQAVDLCDRLHFELSDADQLTCTDPSIPTDGRNLVLKAADLFRKKTGYTLKIQVHLEKHIPYEAGLGGGSSNAATTLWALNELSDRPAQEADLALWASELGADVPFFFSSGSAYCTGIGEIIASITLPTTASLWIIKPNYGLPTPLVYKNLKIAELPPSTLSPEDVLQDFLKGKAHYFNDLETSAFSLRPELAELKRALLANGFPTALMSGSGTAFFCIGPHAPPPLTETLCWQVQSLKRKNNQWYVQQ